MVDDLADIAANQSGRVHLSGEGLTGKMKIVLYALGNSPGTTVDWRGIDCDWIPS